jgi:hypothetical protein
MRSAHVLTACACYINQLSPAVYLSSLCTEQSWLLQTVERILSKCAGNVLLLTISVKDYVLFMFTHVACARACVIKHSLNYEPILFAVNILQLTTSSKGYVLFMFTHHVCERACARGYTFIYIWTDSHTAHTTNDHKLHSCASVRVRARVCEHTTYRQRLHEPYNVCVNACLNSAHQYIFCQARDGQ